MNGDDDYDPSVAPISFPQNSNDDLIVAEYITPNPDSDRERSRDIFRGKKMDRVQVQDLIAASEAKTDLKFEQILNEVRAISVNSAHQFTVFGTGLGVYEKSLTDLDTKVDGIKADNIRTRATVRTSAIALASLFIAVTALLLNGLVGSFNIGSKVGDVSRAEALKVYEERAVPPATTSRGTDPSASTSPLSVIGSKSPHR